MKKNIYKNKSGTESSQSDTNYENLETTKVEIFIVDDDEQQAGLMLAMTETANLAATVFTSSNNFLTAEITENDIVILDLQMPEKDGIEIMREITRRNISPTFILVSGFDERVLHSARLLAESKKLTVAATLCKPIKAKEFISLLIKTFQDCESSQKQTSLANNYSVSNNSDESITDNKISVDDINTAIRRHQLTIYFQPQVYISNYTLKGAEALVRWQHPTRGLLLPHHFIPIAEKHNLMNLLTEEILMLVIKEYHKFTAKGLDIKVSVNLSAQNIHDLSMPEKLATLLQNNRINPKSFDLEISESELMNQISDSLDILNRLRMKGFSLSIDDFGSGHSSLVKLYQAPFAELKIDQHFVMRMTTDHDAASIVRICILLAKELKMTAVAKNVETKEIWNQLKTLGCDLAQGNFIALPMPAEKFSTWVEHWNKSPDV